MSGRTKDKTRNLAFSKLPAHHTYLKWTAYDRPKPCELLVVHSVIAILLVYLFMIHVVRFFWELSKVTFMSEGFRFYCVIIVIGNRKDNRRQSKWPGQVTWSGKAKKVEDKKANDLVSFLQQCSPLFLCQTSSHLLAQLWVKRWWSCVLGQNRTLWGSSRW